jgi:phosphate transport system substrate-binding protein
MKKLSLLIASIAALTVATVAQARDQIQIVGSSTVFPYATVVAERFGQSGFKTPVIESTGTGGGAKLFCAGVGENHPDITNASRAMKDKEKALCKKNGVNEIVEIVVGNDGITLAYSRDAKPVNFTKEQLYKALSAHSVVDGKLVDNIYKNWNEIDSSLPNKPIKVMIPPGTSGTRDAWNSLVMKKGMTKEAKALYKAGFEAGNKKYKKPEKLYREDGAAIEVGENDSLIIQKLVQDKDMFGFFGFSYFLAAKDKLQAASIDGGQPSLKSIQDYSYAVARPLFFYVKKAHIGVIPGLHEFVKEFTTKKAIGKGGYLAEIGLVPLDNKMYKNTRTNATKLVAMSN